jgi:hypothetical protein
MDSVAVPWLAAGFCLLLTLALMDAGWWRAAGVGPQVQAPMFYDAHYLFPRPWTQAQQAPGVPPPAPVAALYGPNRLSQPFVAGSDGLALVGVWLAGEPGTAVTVSLAGEGVAYQAGFRLDSAAGRMYTFSFPRLSDVRGSRFMLTLEAPLATAEQPVTARAVGGDRLGGSLLLNEYSRPGNLELYSYAAGRPGRWWLEALSEQLLPSIFRLRVQQYKPPAFKGAVFPVLLAATMGLSAVFLILARPSPTSLGQSAGWWLAGLLLALLVWQAGSGRLLLRALTPTVPMQPVAAALDVAPAPAAGARLVHDLSLTLWAAERLPEPRFVKTGWLEGRPGIRAPAASSLRYALALPPDSRFHAGIVVEGDGEIHFRVRWNSQEIFSEALAATTSVRRLELDLSELGGQPGFLELATEPVSGSATAWWLAPQIDSRSSWLLAALPAEAAGQPAAVTFGDGVQLAGFALDGSDRQPGQPLEVKLYWQTVAPIDAQATIFVHLLDESGAIITQHDAPPLDGAYPISTWQPDRVIADIRRLDLPDDAAPGPYRLAVGLYDPVTLVRWPAYDAAGSRLAGDVALFDLWEPGSE